MAMSNFSDFMEAYELTCQCPVLGSLGEIAEIVLCSLGLNVFGDSRLRGVKNSESPVSDSYYALANTPTYKHNNGGYAILHCN